MARPPDYPRLRETRGKAQGHLPQSLVLRGRRYKTPRMNDGQIHWPAEWQGPPTEEPESQKLQRNGDDEDKEEEALWLPPRDGSVSAAERAEEQRTRLRADGAGALQRATWPPFARKRLELESATTARR